MPETTPPPTGQGLTEDDGPECELCGKTDCPDANLVEFSEPVACAYRPVYEALRYDRCEYGCGRDVTKATIRRDVIPALAPLVAEEVAAAEVRALREFVAWVASHRAYNGSDFPHGQSLYNECINGELPKWAEDWRADRLAEGVQSDG